MFDLRYHVVSLAAVFLALVLGVLLGVGISETGRVDDVGAGAPFRYRELEVPVDADALEAELSSRSELARFSGRGRYGELGEELARELVAGGGPPPPGGR